VAEQQPGVFAARVAEAQARARNAAAAVTLAEDNLSYTVIRAPFDGIAGNRAAELGRHVTPGEQLIAVAPLPDQLYVVANFKETQLRRMRPGMKVRLIPDIDPGAAVDGTVNSLAPATGALFSLLPPENVTGNFTEVVQRVPVKIEIDPAEAAWVQTSNLIAEIVMIPLSGWLSRRLSTRVLFVASAPGFTLFSLACAGASSLGEIVIFRAAQGFIDGAMIPPVFATTYLLFSGERRTQVSVPIGLTATLAPTIGPTLGGWLTDRYSWHWLFLINLPVGAAVAVAVWNWLDIDRPDWSLIRRFDAIGLVLMAAFLGALEYVLEEGERWDWLSDRTIAWCAVISSVAGVLFFWRMLSRRDPLVELRAFGNVNFAFGSLFSFVPGIGLYGSVYLVPLFLARV